ncbi:MAG: metal ABC transporter ATP-binding protein [Chloroflexi bacterium]|nr:metal ABC transporter ATP-binding protein [Chloroflexota bacterium]
MGRGAPALAIEGVEAGYEGNPVLHEVSATLEAGQAAALLGPNGSGKSTLLKVVLGLLVPWSGRVELFGEPPHRLDRRKSQIGYVPQLREVDRGFPATVFDLAMMGRVGRLGLFRRPGARDREVAAAAMEDVRMDALASRPFGALSGGQQQRAFIARALAQEPDLLVLDEPVAGIDAENRVQIGEMLTSLRARGVPLLIATHDVEELRPFRFDQYWTLSAGRLRTSSTPPAPAEPGAIHHRVEPVPPREGP